MHTGGCDLSRVREEGEEAAAEEHKAQAEHGARRERVAEADPIGPAHAVAVARAVVLPDEAGTGCVEGSHDVVDEAVRIGGGGVAFDHQGVEAVDACLNEQVGNGEDGVLQTGGAAQCQQGGKLVTVQSDAFRPDTVGILRPDESNEDQDGRQVLRQDTG